MNPLYGISVYGGLEEIACQEIQTELNDTGALKIVDQKPGRILVSYSGDPRKLLSLRSAEHVFLLISHLQNMTRSRHSLSNLRKALERVNFHPHFEVCRRVGSRLRKRVTFRVTSHMSGRRNYRRLDAQHIVEQACMTYGWRLTDDNPILDVWVEIHGQDAYISIRISPLKMAQRDYKQVHIPASLNPTVAYCLVHLSLPQPNDIFLDPMCGAGTILIERASCQRYRYLLGGDISPDAVQAVQTNIGRKHRPRQIFHWDTQTLPLAQWTVDKIVCNLPFGEQIGDRHAIAPLYQRFLKECERILKPTGRMVLLTTRQAILDNLVRQQSLFKVEQKFRIDLRGQGAWIYCISC